MPNVTKKFWLANRTASSRYLTKALGLTIKWSDGRTIMTAFGFSLWIWAAAQAIAGAVFLPSGSNKIFFFKIQKDLACWAIFWRWSLFVTIKIWAALTLKLMRVKVSCKSESSPIIFKNCLGFDFRDSGQNRVPDPPARMTAYKSWGLFIMTKPLLAHGNFLRLYFNLRTEASLMFYRIFAIWHRRSNLPWPGSENQRKRKIL